MIHSLYNRKSFWSTIRYHIGSLALGAFILTILWVLRIVIEMAYVMMICLCFKFNFFQHRDK